MPPWTIITSTRDPDLSLRVESSHVRFLKTASAAPAMVICCATLIALFTRAPAVLSMGGVVTRQTIVDKAASRVARAAPSLEVRVFDQRLKI